MRYTSLTVILIATCIFSCAGSYSAPEQKQADSATSPINIILFIGDGMQYANELAASRYLYGTDTSLEWHDFPYQAYVATWDIDTYNRYARRADKPAYSAGSFDPLVGYDPSRGGSAPWPIGDIPDHGYIFNALPTMGGGDSTYAVPATDSASAATAIATGQKTAQGNISWAAGDPENGQLTTIAELIRDTRGSAIGVVSTVEFSHATPAAFVAHNVNRGNPGQIAHEIITQTRPEVAIGAGHPDYISGYISQADYNSLRDSDFYTFVERETGMDGGQALLEAARTAADSGRGLFGLFGGELGCFDHPVPHDTPGSFGFDTSIENPTLAQATSAALTVLSQDPDGFFLMVEQGDLDWANHYNDYHWMIGSMWDLDRAVKAAVDFIDTPGDSIDWTNTLIIVTADHATGGLRIPDLSALSQYDLPEMTGRRYHYDFPGGEVDYNVTVHTNEPVMIHAKGAGSDIFGQYEGAWYPGTRIIDNTQIFDAMRLIAGI